MKIVVIGGTGLIGRHLVADLSKRGQKVVAASPDRGVDTLKGTGLAEAFAGANVVADVTNSSPTAEDEALAFFQTSTTNIVAAAKDAGIAHLVTLSVVGTSRLQASKYFQGKAVQEKLVTESGLPFTIVHSTQVFEFMKMIADGHTRDGVALLPIFALQPIASSDVGIALADAALAQPAGGVIEIAGPERAPLTEFVGAWLGQLDDPRPIVVAPEAGFFGTPVDDSTLVPGDDARIMPTRFGTWLAEQASQRRT